jgi:hypothetical protein
MQTFLKFFGSHQLTKCFGISESDFNDHLGYVIYEIIEELDNAVQTMDFYLQSYE